MKETTLKEFIEKHAAMTDTCYYYKAFSKEVQESLDNIFRACWRFNLRNAQIIFMLNEALKPYDNGGLDLLG